MHCGFGPSTRVHGGHGAGQVRKPMGPLHVIRGVTAGSCACQCSPTRYALRLTHTDSIVFAALASSRTQIRSRFAPRLRLRSASGPPTFALRGYGGQAWLRREGPSPSGTSRGCILARAGTARATSHQHPVPHFVPFCGYSSLVFCRRQPFPDVACNMWGGRRVVCAERPAERRMDQYGPE